MDKQQIRSIKAVVLIPEIYGINQYIKDWADFYKLKGYDTYYMDLSGIARSFSYSESEEAYDHFMAVIGFEQYKEVDLCLKKLREHYHKTIVFGSSVGATIAWRLTESQSCDGMIGYYGSRIRDYLDVNPICPCLLIFPEQEASFEVQTVIPTLERKQKVETHVLPGEHGFADPHGNHFHLQSGKKAVDLVEYFLSKIEQSEKNREKRIK